MGAKDVAVHAQYEHKKQIQKTYMLKINIRNKRGNKQNKRKNGIQIQKKWNTISEHNWIMGRKKNKNAENKNKK